MKIVVIIFLLLILASLGSALFYLVTDRGQSKRTARALALRVGLSVLLLACILLSYWAGWIHPTGIPLGK